MVLAMLAVVTAALLGSLVQTPVYEARARVLAEIPNLLGSSGNPATAASSTETESEVLASEAVQTLVRQRLGETPPVSGEPVGRSQVMEVVAESTRRSQAAPAANAYADAYVDYRRQQISDRLLSATREVGAKVDELTRQIDGLGTNDPRRAALLSQLGVFRTQLDQLQVDAALIGGGPQVLVRAVDPDSPVRPRTGRNLVVAAAVGLGFGLLLLLLLERLDDSIRTRADVADAVPGVPVLGIVPPVAGWTDEDVPVLASRSDPGSPTAEAYRSLRTSLRAVAHDRPLRTVLVTGARPGDGSSTTATNLATALARAGQEVVVVDCDLRQPRAHRFFGLSNQVGFTSVLLGEAPLSAALLPVPGEQRLRLLPSGPVPPNSSELLASQRAAEVVAALAAQVDWVIVDSPALLTVTDATVLAQEVDGVVLVLSAGKATGSEVAEAMAVLEPVKASVVGVVLNGRPAGARARRRGADTGRPDGGAGHPNGSGRSQGSSVVTDRPAPLRPEAGVRESS